MSDRFNFDFKLTIFSRQTGTCIPCSSPKKRKNLQQILSFLWHFFSAIINFQHRINISKIKFSRIKIYLNALVMSVQSLYCAA